MYYTIDKIICKEQSVKTMKNYFGKNLRYLRISSNMTQTDLGDILHVSHQTVSNYERNSRICELDTLIIISEIFNVSIDELLKNKLN